jgi:Tol biopolymer transport system component
MATDGTNFQKTSSPGAIGTPDFSPDGSQIVFCELRSALYGIYLIQVPK